MFEKGSSSLIAALVVFGGCGLFFGWGPAKDLRRYWTGEPAKPARFPAQVKGLPTPTSAKLVSEPYAPPAAPKQEEPSGERTRMTDAAIIAAIISMSRAKYHTHGPCACPDDHYRTGRICGGNSAYKRPNGYAPLCYPKDVTPKMIQDYRVGKFVLVGS